MVLIQNKLFNINNFITLQNMDMDQLCQLGVYSTYSDLKQNFIQVVKKYQKLLDDNPHERNDDVQYGDREKGKSFFEFNGKRFQSISNFDKQNNVKKALVIILRENKLNSSTIEFLKSIETDSLTLVFLIFFHNQKAKKNNFQGYKQGIQGSLDFLKETFKFEVNEEIFFEFTYAELKNYSIMTSILEQIINKLIIYSENQMENNSSIQNPYQQNMDEQKELEIMSNSQIRNRNQSDGDEKDEDNQLFSQKRQRSFSSEKNENLPEKRIKPNNSSEQSMQQQSRQIAMIQSASNQQNETMNSKIPNSNINDSQVFATIKELVRLIIIGQKKSEKTFNQNIVFLLGKTGGGKSTIIHYLKGIKFHSKSERSANGLKQETKLIAESIIEGFQIGDGGSKTKSINITQIEDPSFMIVDTPGLYDTTGFEFDVANTTSLQAALHNAKSVRMLIVIHSQSIFDDKRGATLVQLIEEIIGYMANITIEQFIKTATIIISHSDFTNTAIIAKLQNILKLVRECELKCSLWQIRQKIIIFISSMVAKLDQNQIQEQIQFINHQKLQAEQQLVQKRNLLEISKTVQSQALIQALQSKIKQKQREIKELKKDLIIHQLQSKQVGKFFFNNVINWTILKVTNPQQSKKLRLSLANCPTVTNPRQAFKLSIKSSDLQKIYNLLYEITISLNDLLSNNRIKDAESRLDQINLLNDHLKTEEIKSRRDQCCQMIEKKITTLCTSFKNVIQMSTREKSRLTSEEIQKLKQYLNIIRITQKTLIKKLPNINTAQNSLNSLKTFVLQRFQLISKHIINSLKTRQDVFKTLNQMQSLHQLRYQFIEKQIKKELKQKYSSYTEQFQKLILQNIEECKDAIRNRNYSQISKYLKFLYQLKDSQVSQSHQVKGIATKYFDRELKKDYQLLIKTCNNQIKDRFVNKFQKMLNTISIDTLTDVVNEFKEILKLKEQNELLRYIGKQTLNQTFKEMSTLIQENCTALISKVTQHIKRKQYHQLEHLMTILMGLMNLQGAISPQTTRSFASLVSKLEYQFITKSKQTIEEVMKKFRKEKLSDQHIDKIVKAMTRLNQLKWLQSMIGKKGIEQLQQETINNLVREGNNILSKIQNIFLSDLEHCIDDDTLTIDHSFSEISSSHRNSYQNKSKFSKLNNSVKFIEYLSLIYNDFKDIMNNLKTKLADLINNQCKTVMKIIDDKIQQRELHKISLQTLMSKILFMKQIQQSVRTKKIQQTFQQITRKLGNYFQTNYKKIKDQNLSKFSTINSCASTQIKLFQDLKNCKSTILDKININSYQLDFKNMVRQKIQNFLEEIDQNLQRNQLHQANKKIITLRNYRNSDINSILEKSLSEKYDQYKKNYIEKLNQFPQKIQNLFNSNKFDDLIKQYNKVEDQDKLEQVRSTLSQSIQEMYLNTMDDIANICKVDNQKLKLINKRLNQFIKLNALEIIKIPKLNYQAKKIAFAQAINRQHTNQQQQLKKLIEDRNFQKIEQKIVVFTQKFTTILRGIADKDIRIEKQINLKKMLEKQIEKIRNEQFGVQQSFSTNFENYEKLKAYYSHYKTQDSKTNYYKYKNKLFAFVRSRNQEIKTSIEKAKTIKQIDNQQVKIEQLSKYVMKYISGKEEFSELSQEFSKLQATVRGSNSLINNDVYSEQYLNRQYRDDLTKYYQCLKEIKTSYQGKKLQAQSAMKKKQYNLFDQLIKDFKKYQNLGHHLAKLEGINIEGEINRLTSFAFQRQKQLKKDIIHKLQHQRLQNKTNFNSIKEYFKLITNCPFKRQNNQHNQSIYQEIINCLKKILPKQEDNSSISQFVDRMKSISKYQEFILILKEHVKSIDRQDIQLISFVNLVQSIPLPSEHQTLFSQKLLQLNPLLQQHWKQSNFTKITQIAIELQKILSKQSSTKFHQLSNLVKEKIKNTAERVMIGVQERRFEGVNDNIMKIRNAQNSFKNIEGLISKSTYMQIINKIDETIIKRVVGDAIRKLENSVTAKNVVSVLIDLKKWVNNLPVLDELVDGQIRGVLNAAKQKNAMNVIKTHLHECSTDQHNPTEAAICGQIMHHYSVELKIPRISPSCTMNIQDVISRFHGEEGEEINRQELKRIYDIYINEFDDLKELYINNSTEQRIPTNLNKIKDSVKNCLLKIKKDDITLKQSKQNVSILLAKLFVYYSLVKSGHQFYQASKTNRSNASKYLLQPHPVQVISILRFIGCDYQTGKVQEIRNKIMKFIFNFNTLQNHLMEIKSGEGKSIILGIMALLLSLLGYEVYCVCYSEYLSRRDFEDFKEMFKAFDVINKIKYGTFSEICQTMINQDGDVRQYVDQLFRSQKGRFNYKKKEQKYAQKKKRILLVDEVDTFFQKEFYGSTYNIKTIFQNNDVLELIKLIWENKNYSKSQIQYKLKQSPFYRNLCSQYSSCVDRFFVQFKFMIDNVKIFDSRHYIVKNNKIGYKQQDSYSFNLAYGYETMFTYYKQFQKGEVNKQSLLQNLGIQLLCGKYSYADLIEEGFEKIFGVSGTLSNFSWFEKDILKRFKITKKTFAPSVYGDSRRQQQPIAIEPDQAKYQYTLGKTIQDAINNNNCALVFFENEQALERFRDSSNYSQKFRSIIKTVTEKTDFRDHNIDNATNSRTVTFFTAPFGRGTDFRVFDPVVQQKGPLVIQTFLSEEISEEIQIKNRTGRQGKNGNYKLILNLKQLQAKYGITSQIIKKVDQQGTLKSKLFDQKRQQYMTVVNNKRQEQVNKAKTAHQISIRKRALILQKNLHRSDEFFYIKRQNQGKNTEYIFAIDGSWSMSGKPWRDQLNSLKGVLQQIGRGQTNNASVLVFNNFCHSFCQNKNPNDIDVNKISFPSGGTTPNPTFLQAEKIARKVNQKGPKNIYFFYISDGGAVHPSEGIQRLLQLRKQLQTKNLRLDYTSILIGNDANGKQCMEKINSEMGGKSQYVADAGELLQRMTEVLRGR